MLMWQIPGALQPGFSCTGGEALPALLPSPHRSGAKSLSIFLKAPFKY